MNWLNVKADKISYIVPQVFLLSVNDDTPAEYTVWSKERQLRIVVHSVVILPVFQSPKLSTQITNFVLIGGSLGWQRYLAFVNS